MAASASTMAAAAERLSGSPYAYSIDQPAVLMRHGIQGALQKLAENEGDGQTARRSGECEASSAAQRQPADCGGHRAQRHAQPELARALRHGKSDCAVDADRGKQSRQRGEDGNQHEVESLAAELAPGWRRPSASTARTLLHQSARP